MTSSGSSEVDVEPRRSSEADKSFDTKVIGLLECHNDDLRDDVLLVMAMAVTIIMKRGWNGVRKL